MLVSRLASCAATKALVARPSRAFAILVSTSSGVSNPSTVESRDGFRFLPGKAGTFHPAELVTVPLTVGPKKRAKAAQFPSSGGLRSLQGFPRHDSQPRTLLVTRQPAAVVTRLCHRSVFGAKALKTVNLEKFVFSCQTASGMPEPLVSLVFGRKQAPGFRFQPEANSIPPSLSALVTLF